LGRENRKHIAQVEGAYYEVISDAFEGCFAFDIESDDYALETTLSEDAEYPDALGKAISLEEAMV
jgi:hypothetical protein